MRSWFPTARAGRKETAPLPVHLYSMAMRAKVCRLQWVVSTLSGKEWQMSLVSWHWNFRVNKTSVKKFISAKCSNCIYTKLGVRTINVLIIGSCSRTCSWQFAEICFRFLPEVFERAFAKWWYIVDFSLFVLDKQRKRSLRKGSFVWIKVLPH